MTLRKFAVVIGLGAVLLTGVFVWLSSPGAASAQCGSQASSCKNCHEVQAKDPVSAKGAWHTDHAMGDFCANCHAGAVQSTDETAAHAAMLAPLSDVQANCASCHPEDATALAGTYAGLLGTTVGTGAAGPTPAAGTPASAPAAGCPQSQAGDAGLTVKVNDPNTVDYTRTYRQTVLGIYPTNWGNVAVGLMLGLVVVGGGTFAYSNERRRHHAARAAAGLLTPEEYPGEVLAFLPALERLTPAGREALQQLLRNPQDASTLLPKVARLDPEMAARLRTLDAELRALLLALTGDVDKRGEA